MEIDASQDQHHWYETRKLLDKYRRMLSVNTARLYPQFRVPGLEDTGIIADPQWIPPEPIPLNSVILSLDKTAKPAIVTGSEQESDHVRPLKSATQRYRYYSDAVRELAPPNVFENQPCFRLLNVDWQSPTIQFGAMQFFKTIDINEALAHETALAQLRITNGDKVKVNDADLDQLPFRQFVGDPFDLARRPVIGAIGTLTIRGGKNPSMVLHYRDSARVAAGGNTVQLLPAGIFQPTSSTPEALMADLSMWRNIQREYAEELLGHPEYYGKSIDYENLEPFVTLDQALEDGRLSVYCLAFSIDALNLFGDLLTVAIFEPKLYDSLFVNAVSTNNEGVVLAKDLPFTHSTIMRLSREVQLSPGATAAILLTWKHRKKLLKLSDR